jgi:hypothetical protein
MLKINRDNHKPLQEAFVGAHPPPTHSLMTPAEDRAPRDRTKQPLLHLRDPRALTVSAPGNSLLINMIYLRVPFSGTRMVTLG